MQHKAIRPSLPTSTYEHLMHSAAKAGPLTHTTTTPSTTSSGIITISGQQQQHHHHHHHRIHGDSGGIGGWAHGPGAMAGGGGGVGAPHTFALDLREPELQEKLQVGAPGGVG